MKRVKLISFAITFAVAASAFNVFGNERNFSEQEITAQVAGYTEDAQETSEPAKTETKEEKSARLKKEKEIAALKKKHESESSKLTKKQSKELKNLTKAQAKEVKALSSKQAKELSSAKKRKDVEQTELDELTAKHAKETEELKSKQETAVKELQETHAQQQKELENSFNAKLAELTGTSSDSEETETTAALEEIDTETSVQVEKSSATTKDDVPVEKNYKRTIHIGTFADISGIPAAYFIENKPEFEGKTNTVVEKCDSAEDEIQKIISGQLEFGFVPTELAAKTYMENKGSIVVLGITETGNLSIISKNDSVKSIENLKGKTIYIPKKNSGAEYILRHILEKKGLTVATGETDGDVKFDFSIPNSEIAAAVITNKIEFALVSEPFSTVAMRKSNSVKKVLDIQKEFASVETESKFPHSVLIANGNYANGNKEVVAQIIKSCEEATKWVVTSPNKAAPLTQKHTTGILAPIAAKSIPTANFVWESAKDGRVSIERLISIFMNYNPESVGQELPDNNFYYSK